MIRLAACLLGFVQALVVGGLPSAGEKGGPDKSTTATITIELAARASKDAKSATASYPDPKSAIRTILSTSVKTPITVKWTVRNTDAAATVKDVLVHFFVVKQDTPNQQEVPKLTKQVAAESALSMDFRSKDRAEGEVTFTIPAAGCYLVRVELKGIAGKDEREPFAALDLVIGQ